MLWNKYVYDKNVLIKPCNWYSLVHIPNKLVGPNQLARLHKKITLHSNKYGAFSFLFHEKQQSVCTDFSEWIYGHTCLLGS